MTFQTGLLIAAAILALAAVPVVHRIIVGPTILDRAVASDMLTVLLVLAVGVHTAGTRSAYGVPTMLALTALAFIATVAVARFVAREDRRPGQGAARHEPIEARDDAEDIAQAREARREEAAREQAPASERRREGEDRERAGDEHQEEPG